MAYVRLGDGSRWHEPMHNADNEDYVNYGWSRKQRAVLIAGPTASGKSALALALAERVGGVVINADASQVYGCWRILTARPDAADVARAPHRLYGHVSCATAYSVGHWLRDVTAAWRKPSAPASARSSSAAPGSIFTR